MLSLPEKAAAPESMTQYFVVFRFVLHISVADLLPLPAMLSPPPSLSIALSVSLSTPSPVTLPI